MITLEMIKERMSKLKEWALEGNSLVKDLMFPSFKESINFVNKVAEIAEKYNHHPCFIIDYDHVRIMLKTLATEGITEKDFDFAEEIDKI